jgi:hypothetical protein
MRVVLVWLALALALVSSAAHADEHVGVVVTGGGPTIQADVTAYIESWLRAHGYKLASSPLSDDAVTTIANCLVIEDQRCARGVVDARSSVPNVIYAHIDVPTNATPTLAFVTYWFVKGHTAAPQRRICEHCAETSWHGVVDDMLVTLSKTGAVKTGRLAIGSKPPGMTVVLDKQEIGVTPLERDVAAGPHRIVLTHLGTRVGSRKVDVIENENTELEIDASEPERPSRLGPLALAAGGVAAIGVGAGFLYFGSLGGPNQKFNYTDSTPIGIGFLAVGIGAAVGGSILLLTSGASSAPVAALTPGGGYVGWVGRF